METFSFPFLFAFHLVFNSNPVLCKIQAFATRWEEISVNPFDAVMLNCSVILGAPEAEITWDKDNKTLHVDRFTKVKAVQGIWSSFEINNVSTMDAGRYRCKVKKGKVRDDCQVSLYVNCKSHKIYLFKTVMRLTNIKLRS